MISAGQKAAYHLSHEITGEQPVIAVHTEFEALSSLSDDRNQQWLNDPHGTAYPHQPFAFDTESFGYGGAGRIEESARIPGWVALQLALPEPRQGEEPFEIQLRLRTISRTLADVLHYLKKGGVWNHGSGHPQYIWTALGISRGMGISASHPVWVTLTPPALKGLAGLPDHNKAEEDVRQAMIRTDSHLNGRTIDEHSYLASRFGATLGGNGIGLDCPGDAIGFFGHLSDVGPEGLKISSRNVDYPSEQLTLVSGLAAINDQLMRHS